MSAYLELPIIKYSDGGVRGRLNFSPSYMDGPATAGPSSIRCETFFKCTIYGRVWYNCELKGE